MCCKFEIEPIAFVVSNLDNSYYKLDQNGKIKHSKAKIKMVEKYKIGIKDLKPNMVITIIFYFNQSNNYNLVSPTRFSKKPLGIFSSRSPNRPNHLGITTSKILDITDDTITIESSDMFDKTPIIDIKPYFEYSKDKQI
ncbi:MAG: TrmO family methyltransferase domain-containing protein [Pleomorphochaeta sp.]